MSAASSARILRKFVLPAAVKRSARDLTDHVDGMAIDAHDALDITDVAKRPRAELQPLCSDESDDVLVDPRCSEAIVIPEYVLVAEHSHSDNHGYYRYADFIALGRPVVRAHRHEAGLTELHFDNCVVKVRVGPDLNDIIRYSANGHRVVVFSNLSTNGWVTNSLTVLPSFVFLKYLSGFDR